MRLSEINVAEVIPGDPRPVLYDAATVDLAYERYEQSVQPPSGPGLVKSLATPGIAKQQRLNELVNPPTEIEKMPKEEFIQTGQVEQWKPLIAQPRSHFQKIGEAAKRGRERSKATVDYFRAKMDDPDRVDEAYQRLNLIERRSELDPVTSDSRIQRAVYGSADVLGGFEAAGEYAVPLAGAGAGIGAAAGGVGAPVTAAAGGGAGFQIGTTAFFYMQGAGEMMYEMDKMGLDTKVSTPVALAAGVPYAALERLGFTKLAPQLKGAIGSTMRKALDKSLGQALKAYGTKFGTEVATEVGQKAIATGAEELTKVLTDSGIDPISFKELTQRLYQEGVAAAESTALLAGLGGSVELAANPSVLNPPHPNSVATPENRVSIDTPVDDVAVPPTNKEVAVADIIELSDRLKAEPDAVAGAISLIQSPYERGITEANKEEVAGALAAAIEERTPARPRLSLREKRKTRRAIAETIKETLTKYHFGLLRPSRILNRLQGGESGVLTEMVETPIVQAGAESRFRRASVLQNLAGYIQDELGISIPDLISRPVQINENLFLTPSEAIELHMASFDAEKMAHLESGGFTIGRDAYVPTKADLAAVGAWMETEGSRYKALADYILNEYSNIWDEFAAAYTESTGRELGRIEGYSWINVDRETLTFEEDFAQELEDRGRIPHKRVTPGQTETRVKSEKPLKIGAVENFMRYMDNVNHYIAMIRNAKDVGTLLNDARLQTAIDKATNGNGVQILKKWVSDVLTERPYQTTTVLDKALRAMRTNAVVSVLAANVVTALRQPASVMLALAKEPRLFAAVMNDLMTNNYDEKRIAFAEKKSKRIRGRDMERELVELAKKSGTVKTLQGKQSLSQRALGLIRYMDRTTVGILWTSAYRMNLEDGMSEQSAIDAADKIIADTQPMANLEDLPHFYRGSEWLKMMSAFTNQLNQNYNYWSEEVFRPALNKQIGPKEISYRLLMSYMLPAVAMSLISHGGTPDSEDVVRELVAYGFAPHLIWGQAVSSMIQGFDPSGNIATSWAEDFYRASKAKTPGKAVASAAAGVGKLTGVPTSQPIRTVKGIIRLSHGEGDWRELIWSQAAINKEDEKKTKTKRLRRRRR